MAKLSLSTIGAGYGSVGTINANYALMEAALENTLSRDGETPNVMNANIDMNSAGRIVNLQDAVNNQEPVTLAQAAVIAGVTSPLTQDNIGAALWPQHAIETSNSVTAVNLEFYYGDVQRYDAKLDGATNDTVAFQSAVDSGWGGYCDHGTAALTSTVLVGPAKSLTCRAEVTLQRFAGAATTPILQLYGSNSFFDGGGCVIRQNLYDHPYGVVLIGADPLEDETHLTAQAARFIMCYNFKIVGPEGSGPNAPVLNGGSGIYIHSNARRGAAYSGQTTYRNMVSNVEIVNCDILVEFSSDANSNIINTLYGHAWGKACLYFNASYGNLVNNVQFEAALEVGSTRRYAIHLEAQNAGIEADTDAGYSIDAAMRNTIRGYAELKNSPSNLQMSLFTHTEAGTSFGLNRLEFQGNLGGGLGIDGLSGDTALGTNTAIFPGAEKYRGNHLDFLGYEIRKLDDGSDTGYLVKDSWALITGRSASIAESTQEDVFSLDAIGANASGAMIKLSYVAKMNSIASAQVGEIWWGIFNESDGVRMFRKVFEINSAFDEAQIVTPNITIAEGASAQLTKATVGFLTAAPAGTNSCWISWKAELLTAEAQAGADYDLYLKIL